MALFSFEIPEDEDILLVLYEHWVRFLPKIVLVMILFLPVVFGLLYGYIYTVPWGLYAMAVWILLVITLLIVLWLRWRSRAIVFTEKRLFDIDRVGIFRREAISFPYECMCHVVAHREGPMSWIFRYGTLYIDISIDDEELCSRDTDCIEEGVVVLKHLPSVRRVEKILTELCEEVRKG